MADPYDHGTGRRTATFVAGALAGALLVALIWAVPGWLDSGDRGSDGSAGLAPEAAALSRSAAATHLDRCREVNDAQSRALTTGASSLDQWEVHVGAMNKLVRGEITLEQASEFWNQTRVGAARRLERFDAAHQRFHQRTARCPEPSSSAVADPDLRSCAQSVAARNRALRLASVALETWRMHVHHMEMLRTGEMSAEEATQLWLQSWRQGNREIGAYRAAADTAESMTC